MFKVREPGRLHVVSHPANGSTWIVINLSQSSVAITTFAFTLLPLPKPWLSRLNAGEIKFNKIAMIELPSSFPKRGVHSLHVRLLEFPVVLAKCLYAFMWVPCIMTFTHRPDLHLDTTIRNNPPSLPIFYCSIFFVTPCTNLCILPPRFPLHSQLARTSYKVEKNS